jgi:transcriptional regulator with XRE-family HTH domain
MSHDQDLRSDGEYAHTYLAELQDQTIAAQVRVLREHRGWSQEHLGKLAGMAQARVSLIESGEYSGFTLATLRKLAAAFDVGLHVSFAPYFRTIHWIEQRDAELLRVPSRDEELGEVAATCTTALSVIDRDASPLPDFNPWRVHAESGTFDVV